MNIISPTGVGIKSVGDPLTSADINSINSTVNADVEATNELLKCICNANSELNDFTRKLSLGEAISAVPKSRRSYGMKLTFLSSSGKYSEYIFSGNSLEDDSWNNESNWNSPFTLIDGGEW